MKNLLFVTIFVAAACQRYEMEKKKRIFISKRTTNVKKSVYFSFVQKSFVVCGVRVVRTDECEKKRL
jgi:hypothetical protein